MTDRLDAPLYHEITIPLTEWERVVADLAAAARELDELRAAAEAVSDWFGGGPQPGVVLELRAVLLRAALHREDGA